MRFTKLGANAHLALFSLNHVIRLLLVAIRIIVIVSCEIVFTKIRSVVYSPPATVDRVFFFIYL